MTQLARSAVLIGFDSLCRQLEINPQQLMLTCGLDPLLLRRPDLHLSYARFSQLLTLAAQQGNCPDFGLRLSEYHDYLVLGPFGLMLSQADSFLDVLKLTQQYVHLHAQGIQLNMITHQHQLDIHYQLNLPSSPDNKQLLELGVGVVHRSMQSLFATHWQPQRINFFHAAIAPQSFYHDFFHCPVFFEQPFSGIVTSVELLTQTTIEQRHEIKRHLIEQYVERHHLPTDIKSRVQLVLQSILPTGEAKLEVVARLLNLHPRSLQLLLQEQSTSFRKLLDEVRFAEATQQLSLSSCTITDLALQLGYADETAFSRAFKRQCGLSPAQWRKQQAKLAT